MKKVSIVLAGLLFVTNYSFADDHTTTALEQANFAIKEGSAGNALNLVKYASRALDKTLADSLTKRHNENPFRGGGNRIATRY
jgi:hypothetical protein